MIVISAGARGWITIESHMLHNLTSRPDHNTNFSIKIKNLLTSPSPWLWWDTDRENVVQAKIKQKKWNSKRMFLLKLLSGNLWYLAMLILSLSNSSTAHFHFFIVFCVFVYFFVLSNKQSNLKVYLNFNSRRSKGWKNFNYCVVKRFYNEVQRNFRNSLHFTISTRSTTRKERREKNIETHECSHTIFFCFCHSSLTLYDNISNLIFVEVRKGISRCCSALTFEFMLLWVITWDEKRPSSNPHKNLTLCVESSSNISSLSFSSSQANVSNCSRFVLRSTQKFCYRSICRDYRCCTTGHSTLSLCLSQISVVGRW